MEIKLSELEANAPVQVEMGGREFIAVRSSDGQAMGGGAARKRNGTAELFGDKIKRYLTKIGVTKENYRYAKEAFGLAADCRCNERQQMLNEIHTHAKAHGWISALAHAKELRRKAYHPLKLGE